MELRNPEYLAGILVFSLLLFLLSKKRKRGYYFSGQLAVKKIGLGWRALNILPTILYVGVVGLLLLALAAPFTQTTLNETVIEGKILVPVIDVSYSMDEKTSDGRTKLEVVKGILKEFVETREGVDTIGLVAFSGGGDEWGAGIIQRPTISKEVFVAASDRIRSQMFGGNTAIGEGIFISILALNEMEWHKKLQLESGNPDKEFETRRLWAAANTLDLPELGMPYHNPNAWDDFIVYEVVRLTPPETNRNKVIILFSDGDSNTGLDPVKAIWLAKRLGIKVYYIEVLSGPQFDNSSGDYSNVPPHRHSLIESIKRTGGEYFAGQNYADVQKFFMEISKLENNKVTVVGKLEVNESYELFVGLASLVFILLVTTELILNI